MTYPPEPPNGPGWGQGSPGYPAYWYAPPKHPSANTAMVLGIVALAGGVTCYLPLLCAPFAWAIGARAVREIDASGGQLGGRSEANAGKILGIVGTALLIIGLVFFGLYLAFVATLMGPYFV